MLNWTVSPVQIDADCRQVSCHFDKTLYREQTAVQLGIALPPTLNGAVPQRKAEFIAGRYCARTALAQLDSYSGVAPRDAPIGIGVNREPLWPPGIVGSITHTHGYACAVVANQQKVRAIGLDSEKWIEAGRADNVSEQILTSRECDAEQIHLFDSPMHYLTLVFSAKESLFKCLFPLVNRFFDFHTAVIIPQRSGTMASGEFRFELLEDLSTEFRAGYSGHGSYSMEAACVHTAIVLKAYSPG